MMSANKFYGKPCPNQLQFNLGIPLTTQNLVTHFHQPSPIMIERIGGQNAIPGGVKQPIQENLNASAASSCNFSVLSEEKMARLTQLAQRNLKNMKMQAQMREKTSGSCPSGHPLVQGRQKSAAGVSCSRQRKDGARKPTRSTRSKEVAKNRPVGDVQTPRPTRPVSHSQPEAQPVAFVSNANVASKKKDTFFPIRAADENKKEEAPKGELGKVQTEIENSLTILKQIAERALADGGATNFLRPLLKGKEREGFLYEEEGLDRARHRSEEQNTRFTRTLYNLRQRVKHLQRETTQADLNIPSQKRHVQNQLVVMYRHVSQALHTFLNQLPFQDLTYGLPAHYSELNLMIQQLTVLGKVLSQETDLDGQTQILQILDDVDAINSQWSSQNLSGNRQGFPQGKRKNAVTKEWVSDTKVEADLFAKMESALGSAHHLPPQRPAQHHAQKKPPQRGRPKKRAPGKENKINLDKRVPHRKGTASVAGQSQVGFVPVGSAKSQPAPSVAWEVNLGKSVMLPTNLIAQREKARRAVELSKQNEPNFCEPTLSSKLKSSSQRPSSAPASQSRRKEVNFDLDHKTLLPWIPAGSGPYRPRSASLEQRSFLKETDIHPMRQESLNYSPRMGSLKMPGRDRGDARDYGFLSLPAHQHTRSHQVSDSFLECVEQGLFDRMMQRKVTDSHPQPSSTHLDQMAQSIREQDEALDITDLYVEGDSSLNDTNSNVKDIARKKAVSLMDAPTLENIKLRLDDMQRKQQEIRMRWSTVKFVDNSKPVTRKTTLDYPPEPGLWHVEKRAQQQTESDEHSEFNKPWSEEPVLFTKAYLDPQTHRRARGRAVASVPTQKPVSRPKQLVSLKQTAVERLVADRDKFESFLQRRSHHPSGKFDPWTLMEEISDAILMDCLQDVSEEVEKINEEIANHMYKSEFMVTSGGAPGGTSMGSPPPDFPPAPQRLSANAQSAEDQEVKGYPRPYPGLLSDGHQGDAFKTGNRRPLVASEPLLEDVSQFMSSKMEEKAERSKDEVMGSDELAEERKQTSSPADAGDEEEEDDVDEEDDDDDDDDNYSDDDFEDVSDVEL